MTEKKLQRMAGFLSALTLGLALWMLLWSWLAHATPDPALGTMDAGVALADEMDASAVSYESSLPPDPRIGAMMAQITTGTVTAYERSLTGEEGIIVGGQLYTLTTRNSYSGEPISQATRYVYEHFQDLGLDVSFHEYTWSGHHWRNVVGEQQGLGRADEIYLITAHLDDMPPGPVAPGADDNASGATAVLVAADVLSQLDFDCTLRFVLFTGEEQGLRGSAAYAAAIAAAGEDVRGVLNLDMIGYNSDAVPTIDLHAHSAITDSVSIAEAFSQVVSLYDLDLAPEILIDHWLGNYSDNKSFWNQRYPAILAIEDYDDFTPYYHTVSDTLDTLDLDYFTEFVRAGVGTFAHLGCLSTGLLTGTVTDLETGWPLSSTLSAVATNYAYTTTTRADGLYSLTLPAFTFTLHAQANRPGYQPGSITNVIIRGNATTVQDFALEPWPHRFLIPVLIKQSQ